MNNWLKRGITHNKYHLLTAHTTYILNQVYYQNHVSYTNILHA